MTIVRLRDNQSKELTNLELFTSLSQRVIYSKKYKSKRRIILANYQMKQSTSLKEIIVKLNKMGFQDEKVERAFHYLDI
jgi:hypothetical protein